MIDSIGDKGTALSSHEAKGKLRELNNHYKELCQAAQEQVNASEDIVDHHQGYQDSVQQCRDWMTMTKDKLAVCSEVTGDRQTLQNRLDRIQDLLSSLKDGKNKVKAAHDKGKTTLPQTGKPGQGNIHHELETLTTEFETLATRLGDTQQNLTHAIQAMHAYDGSCDSLNKWLREVETQIKENDLKCTLPEKRAQVEKLKVNFVFKFVVKPFHP